MSALVFDRVTHRYAPQKADKMAIANRQSQVGVSDVSFRIANNTVACLLGPSGSGKSTIIRCAAGFEQPLAGSITLGQETVFRVDQPDAENTAARPITSPTAVPDALSASNVSNASDASSASDISNASDVSDTPGKRRPPPLSSRQAGKRPSRWAIDPAVFVPPHKRQIGVVFQDYALFPHLTVFDNVAFGLRRSLRRRDADFPAVEARVHAMLDLVGLQDKAKASPGQLSGGQQQRVALARALAPAPLFLLLDEPFSGLDLWTRARVRDKTLHVLDESQTACLIVSHQPNEAMYMADQLLIIDEGKIVQDSSPEHLYSAPLTLGVASMMGEVNHFGAVIADATLCTDAGQVALPHSRDGLATIAFRPEQVTVTANRRPETAQQDNDTLDFCMRITVVRHVGMHLMVHLDGHDSHCGDLHFHALLPLSTPRPGQEEMVWVSIPRDALTVFDGASGQRHDA
ncbi:MAG: ABC transporter ATP-binding protein [Alphaproteobacteria bacterium]|nr:ABC transporter ATP-binding protein [Alphaproteobacteria bacterium]